MSVITFPTGAVITGIEWMLPTTPTQINRSRWTGKQKVVVLTQATRWSGRFALAPTDDVDVIGAIRTFLMQLKGQGNTFYLPTEVEQHSNTEPVVNGAAAQGDETLTLDGMDLSTDYFIPGDLVSIPLTSGIYQAVIVRTALTSSGTGTGTLTFDPALRDVVDNNAVLTSQEPFVEVSMQNDGLEYLQSPGSAANINRFDFGPYAFEEAY